MCVFTKPILLCFTIFFFLINFYWHIITLQYHEQMNQPCMDIYISPSFWTSKQNWVLYKDMDGPREWHIELSKSEREK